jgi:hypothetical protein
MASQENSPRTVSWETFINSQMAKKRAAKRSVNPKTKRVTVEGIHRLYVGRTRSGKTTLCRVMTRMEKTVVVIGTKPNDPSLDDYIYKEHFTRIDHWPPKPKELRQRGEFDQVKLLLWPELKTYGDLKKYKQIYRDALRQMIAEGSWSVVVDEGYQVCRRAGLDLSEEVSELAYGGAGNGNSLSVILQRPSGVPVIIHEQCHELYNFRTGNENDIRALASYVGEKTTDFTAAVRGLNRGNPEVGHQFLHAPMTDGATWEVAELPKGWA